MLSQEVDSRAPLLEALVFGWYEMVTRIEWTRSGKKNKLKKSTCIAEHVHVDISLRDSPNQKQENKTTPSQR